MQERQGASFPRTAVAADLVGRDLELAQLRDAVDAAADARGCVLFLVGEAGIGKSRLARSVAAVAASRGFAVLSGRAVQAPAPAAYRPLVEALSSAVRAGVAPAAETLGPFRAMLGRLVPQWRSDVQPLDDSLVAVAEAVLRFLSATAAGSGALLVLEDLHWGDPETVIILEYLADNLAAERVLCLVTVRDDERSIGLELARSLRARRVSPVVQLAPLDRQGVAAMVASCLGFPAVPDEVVEFAARADGIPFMVEELLAAALSSGALVAESESWRVRERAELVVPFTFGENMQRRLAQLGEHCRAVVVAAAVLGRRFSWELLPAITDLSCEDVLAALHEAVKAQIVSFDRVNGSFGFRHALSREAVLAGLFPAELEVLSRRALDAVESSPPDLDDGGELAAELALGAGDSSRAATRFLDVARRACKRGALATAEATLDRARSLLPETHPVRLAVDEFLLQVLSLAGKRGRAVDVAGPLLARLGHDPQRARRRVEVRLRLARAAVAAAQWDEAHELLEQARREATALPEDDLAARLDAARAQIAIVRAPERAPALARAVLERAERLGLPDVACEALEVLGRSLRQRDLTTAEDAFTSALALAEANGLTLWGGRALHELGAIDMLRGRPLVRLEEARELALRQGALATAAVVDMQVAAALVISDDPEAGAVAARRAVELAQRYRLDQTLAAAVGLEAYVHARLRRRTQMQRCVDEARALAAGVPDIEVKVSTAAALLALVEEDRPTARHHLCAGLKAAARGGGDYSVVPAVGLLALVRQVDGPEDEAPEIEIPETSVHFLASSFLCYAGAVAAGRRGEVDAAARLLAEGDRGSSSIDGSVTSAGDSSRRPRSSTAGATRWRGCGRRSPSSRAGETSTSPQPAGRCCGRREPQSRDSEAAQPFPQSFGRAGSPRASWKSSGCSPLACPTARSPPGSTSRRARSNVTSPTWRSRPVSVGAPSWSRTPPGHWRASPRPN